MEKNNLFDSIEELNKRIGKFIILFRHGDGGLWAKLLTKIEIIKKNSKIDGHKIYGKFLVYISSSGKLSVYNFSPKEETYGVYQYARDPTEKEVKLIRKKLRENKFSRFLIKSKL